MVISFKKRLIISFLIVVLITGFFATWIGMHFIEKGIIQQAQEKVKLDLNSAREIYRENLDRVSHIISLTSVRFFLKEGLTYHKYQTIYKELSQVRETEGLDILTLTDRNGRIIYRTSNPKEAGNNMADDVIVNQALTRMEPVSSTQIIPRNQLIKESWKLADQAWMKMIPTAKAKPRPDSMETSGMMLKSAAPIFDNNSTLIGILYGGILINRNYTIVDKIKDTVYKGQMYKKKDIGTATIFQKDLRISTNVKRDDGSRAIGTRVSEEVYDQVLVKGLPWIERAFVVNNWYITAYEPIKNITGDIIGILYVGILEEKFVDMKRKTMLMFLSITLIGVIIAFVSSYFLALQILKPIKHLVFASKQLAEGNLTHKVKVKSMDEIGELAKTFNFMVDSLRDRDERLKKHAQQKIQESERLATIGQLSAGVAHELNNPLGGILVYSHLLLEKLEKDDPKREQLEKIVTQATRCKKIVKGLLDFSRQTEPNMDLNDANDLLKTTLSLLESQTQFQNIKVIKNLSSLALPVIVDGTQIQQVFINILLNATEAMEGKGDLKLSTSISDDDLFVEVRFTDSGCGISQEHIKKLFDPFFTTKEVGRGTGLGLAISYGIIQQHNGTIEVKSQINQGTTFTVRLPKAKEMIHG